MMKKKSKRDQNSMVFIYQFKKVPELTGGFTYDALNQEKNELIAVLLGQEKGFLKFSYVKMCHVFRPY
jgi:hypothetical protein